MFAAHETIKAQDWNQYIKKNKCWQRWSRSAFENIDFQSINPWMETDQKQLLTFPSL